MVIAFTDAQHRLTTPSWSGWDIAAMFDSSDRKRSASADVSQVAAPLTALFVVAPLIAWAMLVTAGVLFIGSAALGALAVQVVALVGVGMLSARRQHVRP
jgi:hypothetical protein